MTETFQMPPTITNTITTITDAFAKIDVPSSSSLVTAWAVATLHTAIDTLDRLGTWLSQTS